MDELLREFLTETKESLDVVGVELVHFEQEPNNAAILGNIFRLVHTIKGTCGFLGLSRLSALAHAAENLIGRFRDGLPVTADAVSLVLRSVDRIGAMVASLEAAGSEPAGDDADLIAELEQFLRHGAADAAPVRMSDQSHAGGTAGRSIRVNVDTLEDLMTMVSELVLTRNQILDMARRSADGEFKLPLQRLSNVTAELQQSVMKARLQPIGNAWQALPRIVRDLAGELGKEIALELHGAETEIDRQVLESIKDPLTHMVRNSADHGLELPHERALGGKPERGTIRLAARHEGGQVVIEIADDGRGLDTARIGGRAVALGLASDAEIGRMSPAQIHKLIFAPGFSTAESLTTISGRGVGMDVVRTNIDRIGGSIEVTSIPGKGAVFLVRIPLTLAIVSSLIVEANGERFAIPQLSVRELVRLGGSAPNRIERIRDAPLLRLRGRLLPLLFLRTRLGLADSVDEARRAIVVVMQVGKSRFGLVVDAVTQAEEIVVKPVSARLREIGAYAGATILGDGAVILILDPNGLAKGVATASGLAEADEPDDEARRRAEASSRVPLLLFRAGSSALKAVPLSLVARLEELDPARCEIADGRSVVRYREHLVPLVCLGDEAPAPEHPVQTLLILADRGGTIGLAADAIVDIVEDRLEIDFASERPGILGCGLVNGQAAEIVDLAYFTELFFPGQIARQDVPAAQRGSVLLVDDSAFFRDMLAAMLRLGGSVVTAVGSAAEALGLLAEGRHFDAVLADLDMPGMTGFELAETIVRDPRHAGLPMIAMSASAPAETVLRARESGFRGCVAKFDRPGLIAALREHTVPMTEAA